MLRCAIVLIIGWRELLSANEVPCERFALDRDELLGGSVRERSEEEIAQAIGNLIVQVDDPGALLR